MADLKIFVPAPDRAPPSNAVGAFAWIRDNLLARSVVPLRHFYSFICFLVMFRRLSNGH